AMDISVDAIVLVDRATMRYIDVNQTLCDLTGRTREELIGLTPMELMKEDRDVLERDYDAIIADGDCPASMVEGQYRRKDGRLVQTETRRRALFTESGWVIVGTVRDVTESRNAHDRIAHLNRVYAVLSGINTLIVRVRNRDELFKEACRIAVDAGGFKMAWIGIVDQQTLDGKVVAWHGGDEGYLDVVQLTARADTPHSDRPGSRALRLMQPVISNDLATDPDVHAIGEELR